MKIQSQFVNSDGIICLVSYEDIDSFELLDSTKTNQVYAVCLFNKQMIIVFNEKKNTWSLVGGGIELGESYEECLKREIKEESNMKILNFRPIGYQAVRTEDEEIYQLRYVCTVEPYGEFVFDPDEEITEIKLINPKDYKQYFNWGEVGDQIITRALELAKDL